MPVDDPEKREAILIGNIFKLILSGYLYCHSQNKRSDKQNKFNNIIYFNDNKLNFDSIYEETDFFVRNTPGAFILCCKKEFLNILKEEIKEIGDKRIIFNLILGEVDLEMINKLLDENKEFNNRIQNICIYSSSKTIKINEDLKNIYPKINENIYDSKEKVLYFIQKYSAVETKPFRLNKIITYKDYLDNADSIKDTHFRISQFYGDITKEEFQKIQQEHFNDQSNEPKKNNKNSSSEEFRTPDLHKDIKILLDMHDGYNKWVSYSTIDLYNYQYNYQCYLFGRIIYTLHCLSNKNKICLNKDNIDLFRRRKLSFTELLNYERVKGRIIMEPNFIVAFDDKNKYIKERILERNYSFLKPYFSVLFIIKNNYKKNCISNIIEFKYKDEYYKTYFIFPFSFFYVKDVKIDLKNYIADIYLETIEKSAILEEQIKKGKEIYYDEKENIIKIKDNLIQTKELNQNINLINELSYSNIKLKEEEFSENKIIIKDDNIKDNEIKKIIKENKQLKKENEEKSILIEKLKQKLKYKDEIINLIYENKKLKNENFNNNNKKKELSGKSKTQENSINELNILEPDEELRKRDNEIRELNKELKSKYPFELSKGEKLMAIIFISLDENIHSTIICKNTDPFTKIEEMLYEIYPDYKESENNFLANGHRVIKSKTLEQNNIHNNDIIILEK